MGEYSKMKTSIQTKVKTLLKKTSWKFLFIGCFVCFVAAVVIGLLLFFSKKPASPVQTTKLPSVIIPPEHIWIPENPLILPEIQFSREQKKEWTQEEIQKFFVEPNEDSLKELHRQNTEKIKKLLEAVE